MLYNNPVKRGFYPDPSVIRVDDDYYMVNSSFQYFPCIPISHSKDMVNWETIGYAISDTNNLDLSDINDSHGIWAPDIFYYEGMFYIIATMRLNDRRDKSHHARQQIIMKSKNPEGPYSKPIWFDVNAIDPSLFVDDDGKKYMVIARAATAWELNDDFTEVIDGPKTVWSGTGERCSEGPHVMKKDGYYYAIVAEGGTGYGHGINIARSKSLFGEYEECPYNPVMRQSDPDKLIQRAGHGKLVEDQNGDWWAYYLCGRRNGGNYTTLGRETALDPVIWTDDGWFKINNGKGPSEVQEALSLPEYKVRDNSFIDEFDDDEFDLDWSFVRNPDYENISLNKERESHLCIWTGNDNLDSISAKNTLVHRECEFYFTADTKLEFDPSEGARAGIVCYYSTKTYIRYNITRENGQKIVELVINRNKGEEVFAKSPISENSPVYLRVETRGQLRRFLYAVESEGERTYFETGVVDPCIFLCDEGVPTDRKRHTGTLTGIFANNGGTGVRERADFDRFSINFEV